MGGPSPERFNPAGVPVAEEDGDVSRIVWHEYFRVLMISLITTIRRRVPGQVFRLVDVRVKVEPVV